MLRMGAKALAQYQQWPYPIGEGEGKRDFYSSLRKGVRWKPTADVEDTFDGFTHVTEEQILLHTIFGEGEHPWPEDMRLGLDEEETEGAMAFLRKLNRESVEKRALLEHAKLNCDVDSE